MRVLIKPDYDALSITAANHVIKRINEAEAKGRALKKSLYRLGS